jgi:SAM-dependent methyltransferase
MLKNVTDDRGYNQIWNENEGTKIRGFRRAQMVLDHMDPNQEKSVLEIGCGTGRAANYFAEHSKLKVLGIDLCIPFIEEAKKTYRLPNLDFGVLDFNKPDDLKGRTFDYIVGNGILHHLYFHLDEALVNIHSLLSPNGKIIFMEPNVQNPMAYLIFRNSYFRKKFRLEPDEMAFSKKFIAGKLNKAGYKNIQVSFKDFLLPGMPGFLVKPMIAFGNFAEKIPGLRVMSQSIFIEAGK